MNQSPNLRMRVFYPDMFLEKDNQDINAMFELWNDVWIETRIEVDPKLPTYSDSFSRQHEIVALFDGDKCIATICHRYVDLRHSYLLHDSYFTSDIWPDEARKRLLTLGKTCALGSHIFIDKAYRKGSSKLNVKKLICNLGFMQINAAHPDLLVGMMRKDRGLSTLLQVHGAQVLYADTNWYQIPVDLVVFFPSKVPIKIDQTVKSQLYEIGSTCSEFLQNYYERHRRRDIYENVPKQKTERAA